MSPTARSSAAQDSAAQDSAAQDSTAQDLKARGSMARSRLLGIGLGVLLVAATLLVTMLLGHHGTGSPAAMPAGPAPVSVAAAVSGSRPMSFIPVDGTFRPYCVAMALRDI